MSLIETITPLSFKRAMKEIGRDNFSYEACELIIEYYQALEGDTEFYPIDMDCTWVEFNLGDSDDLQIFLNDYDYLVEGESFEDKDSKIETIIDRIEEETLVISNCYTCLVFDYNF